MKKSKRKNKRNHKSAKCNGYNVFGERCIEKELVLEKETAWEQFIDVIDDLCDANSATEYTILFSGFTAEEIEEFHRKAEKAMAMRAYFRNAEFSSITRSVA